jgi:hypothetical protein
MSIQAIAMYRGQGQVTLEAGTGPSSVRPMTDDRKTNSLQLGASWLL